MKKRILYAILGAILFISLGNGFVSTMTRIIPTSFWYEIESPITVATTPNTIIMQADRHSTIEIDGEAIIEVVVTEVDRDGVNDIEVYKRVLITMGDQLMEERIVLENDLTPGIYQIKGIVKFELNGVVKREHFYSEKFTIN